MEEKPYSFGLKKLFPPFLFSQHQAFFVTCADGKRFGKVNELVSFLKYFAKN